MTFKTLPKEKKNVEHNLANNPKEQVLVKHKNISVRTTNILLSQPTINNFKTSTLGAELNPKCKQTTLHDNLFYSNFK